MGGVGERAVGLALRRLMPLLVLMHVIAYLDRLNIAFAEDQLSEDLALSATAFGLASGIFFVGYVLFEVPSNLILYRVGTRIWMARIMITWGLLAAATALAWDSTSLVAIRFLLGFAEAGFLPGVVYFLATWFPDESRGKAMAIFMTGIAGAFILGGPLSGGLLELDGVLGLEGWQWLFLMQGLPAVLVGLYVLKALPDRPSDARWLSEEEATWLEQRVEEESFRPQPLSLRGAVRDRRVQLLAATAVCLNSAAYGTIFWIADIIEEANGDMSDAAVGGLAAIPFTLGTVGLIVFGRWSDRRTDRRPLVAFGLLLGAVGTLLVSLLAPVPTMIGSILSVFGLLGLVPAFWTLPSALLTGRAAAGGIALINSVGVTGGLIGPVLIGVGKDATDSLVPGLLVLAVVQVIGAALIMRVKDAEMPQRTERAGPGRPASGRPGQRSPASVPEVGS